MSDQWRPPRDRVPTKFRVGCLIVIVAVVAVSWYLISQRALDSGFAVGQCIDHPQPESGIYNPTTTDCSSPHDAQVVFVGDYPAPYPAAYPSETEFQAFVGQACSAPYNAFEAGSGDLSADVDLGFYVPVTDWWNGGDHTVICYIERIDGGQLTSSL